MKKITSLLMMFMLFVGMGWAQTPKVSTETDTYLYYVLNVRDPYFVTTTKNEQVAQQLGTSNTETDAKKNVIFKLTASGQNYKFYATNFGNKVVGFSGTDTGANKIQTKDNDENTEFTLTLRNNDGHIGFAICPKGTELSWNMFNGKGNNVGLWYNNDGGGVWVFVPADQKTYDATVKDVQLLLSGAAREIGKMSPESQSYVALNACVSQSYSHENAIALVKSYVANANVMKQSLYLPNGYYLMKNVDTSRKEYLYSDVLRQDNPKYQTLQSERPAEPFSNNYIWKVTNEGTTVKIINGQGSLLRADNAGPFEILHFGVPVSGKEGIYFTEALNCSKGGQALNGTHCLTTWSTGGPDANDNRWNFESIPTNNIYSVTITGLTEGIEDVCYLKKGEEVALSGGFIACNDVPKQSDFTLGTKNDKYEIKSFAVVDHTINVTVQTKVPVVQVEYEYFVNGAPSGKTLIVPQTVGEAYNAPVLKEAGNRNMAFVTYSCSEGTVQENMGAVRVDVRENLPFTVTTDEANPVVYYMTINTTRGNSWGDCKRFYSTSNGGFDKKNQFADNAYNMVQPTKLNDVVVDLWYVTGNSVVGFVFHNMQKGKILTKVGNGFVLKTQDELKQDESLEHTWFLRYGRDLNNHTQNGKGKEFGITSTAGGNSFNLGSGFGWDDFDRGSSFIMYEPMLDIKMNVVGDKSYATLSLPYDFALVENDANTKLYTATSVANNVLNCTEVGAVKAEAGVVVKNAVAAEKISVVVKPAAVEMGANLLKGNINEIAFNELAGKLVFGRSKVNGAVGFFKAGGSAPLGANKAYLPAENIPAGANAMVLSFGDGDVTAIEGIETEDSINAPIYDLSGRRVMNTIKGGIYIQNGKKFIVR